MLISTLFIVNTFANTQSMYYVSPQGNDKANGDIAHPFASLQHVADILAQRTNEQLQTPTTVWIKGGTYLSTSSIVLNRKHSNVTWRALNNEKVNIKGSISIANKYISKVSDPKILTRLPKINDANLCLYEIKLSDLGLDLNTLHLGEKSKDIYPQLFLNNKALTLSKSKSFLDVDSVIFAGGNAKPAQDSTTSINKENTGQVFSLKDKELGIRLNKAIEQYKSLVWIGGYWFWDWSYDFIPVSTVDRSGIVTMKIPHNYGMLKSKMLKISVFNLLEEMDSENEYTLNPSNNKIWVLLPKYFSKDLSLSWLNEPIFNLKTVSQVSFENVSFKETRSNAFVVADNSKDITISHCSFVNIGYTAIKIKAQHVIVNDCLFLNLGAGGVSLDGGDLNTLTHANNQVIHCVFDNFSQILRTVNPAVNIYGVGQLVANNLIENAPHSAIIYNGPEHQIINNEIHHVIEETGDCGAIYGGRSWSSFGTTISGNWIHDLGKSSGRWCSGFYLDDNLSGIVVKGNWVDNVELGISVGGGCYNTIIENIFSRTDQAMLLNSREITLASKLRKTIENLPLSEEPWASHYPMLKDVMLKESPTTPLETVIKDNAIVESKKTWLKCDSKNVATVEPQYIIASFSDVIIDGENVSIKGTPIKFEKPEVGPKP